MVLVLNQFSLNSSNSKSKLESKVRQCENITNSLSLATTVTRTSHSEHICCCGSNQQLLTSYLFPLKLRPSH